MKDFALLNVLARNAPQPAVETDVREGREGPRLHCRVVNERRDGVESRYDLVVTVKEGLQPLCVREQEARRRLPMYCPERHIVGKGEFCIGLPLVDLPVPETDAGASAWWARLRGFLLLQDAANVLGTWPKENAWPHGEAAIYEFARLDLLERLPFGINEFREPVSLRDMLTGRLASWYSPCPCRSGSPIWKCHEKELVMLARLEMMRDIHERDWWHANRGHNCCGTLSDCPLARRSA